MRIAIGNGLPAEDLAEELAGLGLTGRVPSEQEAAQLGDGEWIIASVSDIADAELISDEIAGTYRALE